jgi:hypothetical protein
MTRAGDANPVGAPGAATAPVHGAARWRVAVGWTAVAINAIGASLWAFWGAIENFHEGWYWTTLGENLLGAVAYLAPMLIMIALGVGALRFPRLGALAFLAIGATLGGWFIRRHPGGWDPVQLALSFFLGGTGGALAILWWCGRPRPKRWAYRVTWGVPLLVAAVAGAEPAYRVAGRVDDGDRGARLVEGRGVARTWAPAGPGWPVTGVTWDEAVRRCRHLTEDGRALADDPVDAWRLPTVDEIVRSLTRHGRNAGGAWDPGARRATYDVRPDKESPLWDPHSPIIYWWAADEVDADHAYRVVSNGGVWVMPKGMAMGSQAFRAVRR